MDFQPIKVTVFDPLDVWVNMVSDTIDAITREFGDRVPSPLKPMMLSLAMKGRVEGVTYDAGGLRAWYHDHREVAGPSPASPVDDAPTGPIHASELVPGQYFFNALPGQPRPFILCGLVHFMPIRLLLDGQDIQPLVDESRRLRANAWRVFGSGSRQQNGILDLRPMQEPRYYDVVRDLAHRLNDNGIVLIQTVYADNQDVQSPLDVWRRTGDALDGTASLMSGFNQWSKNVDRERGRPSNFDPFALPPVPVPWSRGSDIEDTTTAPNGASWMEFHPRRDFPKSLMDAVASPVDIYDVQNFPSIPLVITEPPRMGTDGSGAPYLDPHTCWMFGRCYGTLTAGAVFHNRAGQRGVPMDAPTYACADAFFDGIRP